MAKASIGRFAIHPMQHVPEEFIIVKYLDHRLELTAVAARAMVALLSFQVFREPGKRSGYSLSMAFA
jgi:hypothetical protein